MDYASVHGLRVAEWYLTMPLNPTNENLQWLEGFTTGHGLLAQWRGLDFLEGLAADYPWVIDYYLRDGKDRLQAALESLGRHLDEATVLRAGRAFEEATGYSRRPVQRTEMFRSRPKVRPSSVKFPANTPGTGH